MEMSSQMKARIFKAFGDENRLEILGILKSGERCACKLLETLNISQPTLSHHMRILQDAGVVNARKDGKWTHYSLNEEGARRVIGMLGDALNIQ